MYVQPCQYRRVPADPKTATAEMARSRAVLRWVRDSKDLESAFVMEPLPLASPRADAAAYSVSTASPAESSRGRLVALARPKRQRVPPPACGQRPTRYGASVSVSRKATIASTSSS